MYSFVPNHWLDPELQGIVMAGIRHGQKAMLQGSRGMETTLRNLCGDRKYLDTRSVGCSSLVLNLFRIWGGVHFSMCLLCCW